MASRLKTFTEQVDDQRLLTRLRGAVGEASSIVFLGFGFHKQNIELLSTASRVHGLPQIYYSGLGIPEQSVQSILRDTVRMAGVAPIPVRVEQTTHFEIGKSAAHVMSVYRRALSA